VSPGRVASADFRLPPRIVELTPILVIQVLEMALMLVLRREEEKVLDEVRSTQGGLTSIQNLEDHLRIVILFQVYHDQLEEIDHGIDQKRSPVLRAIGRADKVPRPLKEVAAGLSVWMRSVDWSAGHHCAPYVAITASWPKFMTFVCMINDVLGVLEQTLNLPKPRRGQLFESLGKAAQQKLNRGQTLLAIDHGPDIQAASW